MTTIDDLVRLVPPPADPVDAAGDWGRVEAALERELPADFKALVGRYGQGQFTDFITPLTPFGTPAPLIPTARRLLEQESRFRDSFPEQCPYPFYPEPGGLLPWAGTDNGDRLCWLTAGEPDSWTVVAWNPRGSYYSAHEQGAVAFLYGWLTGRVRTPVFGGPVESTPWFEPFRERVHVYVELSEGELPYAERLRILRDALAPTADRGSYNAAEEDEGEDGDEDCDDERQDHFAATDLDWRLTYETAYAHQIRVAHPRGDGKRARAALFDAARRMGCEVLSTTADRGGPLPDGWE